LSPLKIAVLVAVTAPALWLAYLAWAQLLGPRPYAAAIFFTGDMAIRFLLVTLLITPLRHILRSTRLVIARRLVGLAALGYALLHLGLYVADLKFDIPKVTSEIVLRFYLTIGFVALVAMVAMGLTSFDSAIKRLGAERWRRLHMLIYPATVLGLLHFFIQSRLDVTEPVLLTGFFLLMMGVRTLADRRWGTGPLALAGLAVVAALLTAGVEVAWYAAVRNVSVAMLVSIQVDFELGIRPMWWVLGTGLSLAAVSALAARFNPAPAPARLRRERAAQPAAPAAGRQTAAARSA
jgi:sulfoxide reductase heme-binding subunit YedZ